MEDLNFIKSTLDRINNKLDKHDDKIDMIVQAMQQLVKVDIETKEIKESLIKAHKSIERLQNCQNTDGCSALKTFVRVRDEQLKHYDKVVKDLFEAIAELRERLDELEQKPLHYIDKIYMAILGAIGAGLGGWILIKLGVGK